MERLHAAQFPLSSPLASTNLLGLMNDWPGILWNTQFDAGATSYLPLALLGSCYLAVTSERAGQQQHGDIRAKICPVTL